MTLSHSGNSTNQNYTNNETIFSQKYRKWLRKNTSPLPVDKREDLDWTENEIDSIRETARLVKEACRNKNPAGIVWYTHNLLAQAGEKRARILLGEDADTALHTVGK